MSMVSDTTVDMPDPPTAGKPELYTKRLAVLPLKGWIIGCNKASAVTGIAVRDWPVNLNLLNITLRSPKGPWQKSHGPESPSTGSCHSK